MKTTVYPNWKEQITIGEEGPQPSILLADDKVKILMAGLAPGQQIPEHPEAESMYYFLEGNGWMTVDGERIPVSAGASIVMPEGAVRGMEAETRLSFLAVRIA